MANIDIDSDLTVDGDVAANNIIVFIDIGANASAARTAGSGIQYWICDNGVTPVNAIEGDLVYNRSA